MNINSLATSSGPSIYFNDEFRNTLEDHLTYLKNITSTTIINIDQSFVLGNAYQKSRHGLAGRGPVPIAIYSKRSKIFFRNDTAIF